LSSGRSQEFSIVLRGVEIVRNHSVGRQRDIFAAGFLKHRQIRAGILPEIEEALVGRPALGAFALQPVSARQPQIGERYMGETGSIPGFSAISRYSATARSGIFASR
jgi:hypothetical protein